MFRIIYAGIKIHQFDNKMPENCQLLLTMLYRSHDSLQLERQRLNYCSSREFLLQSEMVFHYVFANIYEGHKDT